MSNTAKFPITVAYACDENYAPLTAISAASLLRHNPAAAVILLGYRLPAASIALVRNAVERLGGSFQYADVAPEIDRLKSLGCSGYVSHVAYARIFIPSLVASTSHILYLDCDTLVAGSVSPLFSLDMRGKPIALGGDCIANAFHRFINHPLHLHYSPNLRHDSE